VLAQTQTQQGNFVDTASGFANTQRTFASQMENFKADIGEVLLPILQGLLPELRGIIDTFAESDPDKIVELGIGITQLATAVVALNTALKVFAALQGAAKFLFSTAGVLLVPLAAGGSAELIPQEEIDASRARIARGGVDLPSSRPGRNPQTGLGRNAPTQPIIVNGIVGSPYQVFREIERINSTGQRSASTFSGGNR
jgi:hypothetical protein